MNDRSHTEFGSCSYGARGVSESERRGHKAVYYTVDGGATTGVSHAVGLFKMSDNRGVMVEK
ncbi:MAG: hypothetical protein J4G05_12270 [Chlorobi bacterium]|nr:hypothetical protein [Chlorobiota bacterium]